MVVSGIAVNGKMAVMLLFLMITVSLAFMIVPSVIMGILFVTRAKKLKTNIIGAAALINVKSFSLTLKVNPLSRSVLNVKKAIL